MNRNKTSFHSSKGNQFKWCEDNQWYKMDYLGYESLAEIIVSWLLNYTNVENFVVYHHDHVFYNEEIENACVSDNFLNEGDEIITIEKLIHQMKGISIAQFMSGRTVESKIKLLVSTVVDITGLEGFGRYITLLLEIDAFYDKSVVKRVDDILRQQYRKYEYLRKR